MISEPKNFLKWRRIPIIIFSSCLMISLALFVLWANAQARGIANGAGNCGNFIDAVRVAQDGDTILHMTPGRNTDGAVLTENLRISGGWFPNENCQYPNQIFTTTADFLAYGFIYSPTDPSELNHTGSVLTLDDINDPDFPTLDKLVLENLILSNQLNFAADGGGIQGVISDGAEILLDDIWFRDNGVSGNGGGLSLVVRGGSHVIIEDSLFTQNTADNFGGGLYVEVREGSRVTLENTQVISNVALFGGGMEIQVYDTSQVVIHNSTFSENTTYSTNGYGGGMEIIMHGGQVDIIGSTFNANQAGSDQGNGGGLFIQMDGGEVNIYHSHFTNNQAGGVGGGIYVESVGSDPATVKLVGTQFSSNTPNAYDHSQIGSGLLTFLVLDQSTYLPVTLNNVATDFQYARINSITLDESYNYVVDFDTFNFVPALPGVHVHFFFDTVAPEDAGMPGVGPWEVYGGPSPFTNYSFAERPFDAYGAEKMCVLVANPDHTIRLNTGNCVELP